jgi:uncharacterized protein DUF3617
MLAALVPSQGVDMKSATVWCASACLSMSLAAVLVAQAPALDVKMGLWEMTMNSQVGGQMPAIDTSKMTPEQKAKMEEMMKSMMGAHTTVTKTCMTREKFEKSPFMTENQPGQTCKQNISTNTRSTLEATVTCTGEHAMDGQVHFEALSSTSVKGVLKMAAIERGRTMNFDSTLTAKWLGADCGSVK